MMLSDTKYGFRFLIIFILLSIIFIAHSIMLIFVVFNMHIYQEFLFLSTIDAILLVHT
jgi:hypothetical protein